ncbi:MAG: sugar phosphate isomerase/epimerase [Phycisphaerales bacterium]|nr:sugar phosphate isomerase/epimerase [Planctomycetota bacterium]
MKLALSTVACPDWTFEALAAFVEEAGYQGLELRTFGSASTRFACDPALTDPDKVRRLLAATGCEVACVATSTRFDDPITPPGIGHILSGTPQGVRETGWAVDLAARLEAPLVRVFGYQIPSNESRTSALSRIVDRLELAVATARNTGVRLAIENGGSFPTAATLSELLDRVNNPLLGVAYSPAIAALAGESVSAGINVLEEKLFSVKIKDWSHGKPCVLGEGESQAREAIDALGAAGFGGWVVYECDRAWLPAEADGRELLKKSARNYYGWIGGRRTAGGALTSAAATRT